jgi:replicative DNA helicase
MSIGLQLLRSILDSGARTEFRHLSETLFVEAEIPIYQFVARHYRRHGGLPSQEALLENGIRLPSASENPTYYLERARNRAIFNVIAAEQPTLAQAMQSRDMGHAGEVLRRMTYAVGRFESEEDTATLTETVQTVLEQYEHSARNPGRQGVTLGWPYLDDLTNGAEPGDVITYVARPGMGKSWLMTHCARAAWLAGNSVLFVSMEMTATQIARRFLGMHAGINPDYIRRGQLSSYAYETMYATAGHLNDGAPFHFLSGSFEKSVPLVDAAIQEFAPDIVFIDASYLMSPASKGSKKATWELLADVGKEIKEMAMARRRPIVQSVQFNREAKKVKGSGNLGVEFIGGSDVIGQISTIAIAITEGEAPNERSERRLTILKNREGDNGSMRTRFLFEPPDFSFIPPDDHPESYDAAWQP